MAFSKRPAPLNFRALDDDEEPETLSQAFGTAPMSFRNLDADEREPPIGLEGRPRSEIAALDREDARSLTVERGEPAPSGWPTWIIAVGIALLWALGPIAFAIGYRGNVAPLHNDPFALLVFALLAIGPGIFVLGAAYMIRQGQMLAHESRRTKAMAEDMLSPALLAAARSGEVAQAIREEIVRAGAAAEDARETLVALREALAIETEELIGSTAQSVRSARDLANSLGHERGQMVELAKTLDSQAMRVTDAVGQQARMVTEAAGVAETQIREAETNLAARAAELAAAAAETQNAARTAGEDLTRHVARLESAGAGVSEQVRAVEAGLGEQRAALIAAGQMLKSDHAAFTADAGLQTSRLEDLVREATTTAEAMSAQAGVGGEALQHLLSTATLQLRDIAETAKAEREEFGQSTLHALDAVSTAATEHRRQFETQAREAIDALAASAEVARSAASDHAINARQQVDQLSETAFAAGQTANQVFEARLEEARALIAQSAQMLDESAALSVQRLESGANAARATLDELSTLMGDIEARALKLPQEAQAQSETLRASLANSLTDAQTQVRETIEETKAYEAALQTRVQDTLEALNEAARQAAKPPTAVVPEPPRPAPIEPLIRDPLPIAEVELADTIGLRNRIRLTPTATDKEFTAVFEAAGGPPVSSELGEADDDEATGDGEAWTWKDLLASLDGSGASSDGPESALAAELAHMGVDPEALLPQGRVVEIAAALQTGDLTGSREVVCKLAPAATRRIARRLFTDDDVKQRAEVFVHRYRTLLAETIARDLTGALLAKRLDEPGGRLFLLLDAAAGDRL